MGATRSLQRKGKGTQEHHGTALNEEGSLCASFATSLESMNNNHKNLSTAGGRERVHMRILDHS
jgi:hypothetical protein